MKGLLIFQNRYSIFDIVRPIQATHTSFSVYQMLNVLGTTLTGCDDSDLHYESDSDPVFWTAGYKYPPRWSSFFWRVTSTIGCACSDRVTAMTYTNWEEGLYYKKSEWCMHLWQSYNQSYTWKNYYCSQKLCSVCELDM